MIDTDYRSVGRGYFDTGGLKALGELRKERAQLFAIHKGDSTVWHHPDVQLLARAKILKELRVALYVKGVACGRDLFPTFNTFLSHFMRVGGVIEAQPQNIIGRPSVNMFIPPGGGSVEVKSCVDMLTDDEGLEVGSVYPMTSIPEKALCGAALAVGEQLRAQGAVGFLSVNFVAYRMEDEVDKPGGRGQRSSNADKSTAKPAKRSLRMVGNSIDMRLTNAASTYNLVKFVCEKDGVYGAMRGRKLSSSYATIDYLHNPSLVSVRYGAFFKLCRMQSVSFDLESLSGLMFMLFDSLSSGVLGIISVGGSCAQSLEGLVNGFRFIKESVGNSAAYNEVGIEEDYGGVGGFVKCMRSMERKAAEVAEREKMEKRKQLMKESGAA